MTIENDEVTPEQVSLPERFEKPTIATMLPGETTYATPWTLWFDNEGKGWVVTEGPLHDQPTGQTVRMRVDRLRSGFAVDIQGLGSLWSRQSGPQGVGSTAEGSLPVVALVTRPEERRVVDEHLLRLRG